MAASRLLGAAAARVILLSFAAGHGKSFCNSYSKAATVMCHEIFLNLALAIFLVKSFFKIVVFFASASRSFRAAICAVMMYTKASLCKSLLGVKFSVSKNFLCVTSFHRKTLLCVNKFFVW